MSKCLRLTKAGKQCSNSGSKKPQHDKLFCWLHQIQSNPKSPPLSTEHEKVTQLPKTKIKTKMKSNTDVETYGHLEIENGADLPLQWACNGNLEIVELLIKNGSEWEWYIPPNNIS
jgi:ankyrin repeat protein